MTAEANPEPPVEDSSEHLGRYRLLARLGEGGMGAIHLAVTAGLGEFQKIVVLKELKPELCENKEFVNLFLREVMFAGRLNHPNIVQTIEAGQDGGRYFMSMEFLDGQPFSKLFAPAGQPSKVRTRLRLQVLCDVLAGLHYAHELKDYDGTPLSVVHCDVSFGNVFVTYEGQVKLVDFGVARVADTVGRRSGFEGKVRYAAPEQLTGEPIDGRADIYSVGVMLWETLTLRRFTDGLHSDRAIVDARLRGPQTSILALMPQLDPELAEICDRALRRNPKDRFATADEFRKALSGYLAKMGPRIDASEISRLLMTEFEAERAQIHGIISAKLRDPAAMAASVNAPRVPNHDEPTAVADLSTLIESMSQVRAIPAPLPDTVRPAQETRKRASWIALGAALFLLPIVVVLAMKSKPEVPPRAAVASEPKTRSTETLEKPATFAREEEVPSAAVPPEGAVPEGTAERASQTREPFAEAKEPPAPTRKAAAQKSVDKKKTPAQNAEASESARQPATFGQDMAPRRQVDRAGIDSENPFK